MTDSIYALDVILQRSRHDLMAPTTSYMNLGTYSHGSNDNGCRRSLCVEYPMKQRSRRCEHPIVLYRGQLQIGIQSKNIQNPHLTMI